MSDTENKIQLVQYPIQCKSKYSVEAQEEAVRLAARTTTRKAGEELGIPWTTISGWIAKGRHRELYLSLAAKPYCDLCGSERAVERAASRNRYSYCSSGCSNYAHSIVRNYGLAPDEYLAILKGQNYACAVCGDAPEPNSGPSFGLHVDHCHTGNHVRALLCRGCNHMLGSSGDRPDVLERGAEYLRKHNQFRLVA